MRERSWYSRWHPLGMGESGVAILESAAWLAVSLPVVFFAAGLSMFVHDQRVLGIIPEAQLRESELPSLRWVPNGVGGSFGISESDGREVIAHLADTAAREAQGVVVQTTKISSRACYWVMRVDPDTGMATGIEQEQCASTGAQALSKALDATLLVIRKSHIGVRMEDTSGARRFIDRALVFGLAIGGEFSLPAPGLEPERLQFSHIAFPRQEVTL